MLYFHGGYWCSGDANSEDFGCRAIVARGNDIVIASFGYRLAPEHSWRQVFSDAEYAMKWISQHATSLGGAEAGAHLAAICAIRARNRYSDAVRLTGQVLIVPTTLSWPDEEGIPATWAAGLTSHADNAHAPALDEALYEFYLATLGVPDEEKRRGENFPAWDPLEGPAARLPAHGRV